MITIIVFVIIITGYFVYTRKEMRVETTSIEGIVNDVGLVDASNFALSSNEPEEFELEGTSEETVHTINNTNISVSDMISEVRLNRERVRSKNKEALLEVINNTNSSDAQKQEAIDNMIALTDIAERELAAEMILDANGYTDAVVSVMNNRVDVVVNKAEVDDIEREQIVDIVRRKTGEDTENIIIIPLHTK